MYPWIDAGLLVIMLAAPTRIVWARFRKPDNQSPRGSGVRTIQLVATFLLVPLIGILTLEGQLKGETAGALIGVAIGYTLSGVEKAVPSNDKKTSAPASGEKK